MASADQSTDASVVRHESLKQALRDAFLRWQCRIRQIAVRQDEGRPSSGMMPLVELDGHESPLGHIVTLLNKAPAYATVPEFKHMARRTQDPAERRKAVLGFLAATYYQHPREFTDTLTATFAPGSLGAATIEQAGRCTLTFAQFQQRYVLPCRVTSARARDPLFAATYWHNVLFNPYLPRDTIVLRFEPDWASAVAEPAPFAHANTVEGTG